MGRFYLCNLFHLSKKHFSSISKNCFPFWCKNIFQKKLLTILARAFFQKNVLYLRRTCKKYVWTYFRKRIRFILTLVNLDTLQKHNQNNGKNALLVCICLYQNTFQVGRSILICYARESKPYKEDKAMTGSTFFFMPPAILPFYRTSEPRCRRNYETFKFY